MTYIILDKDEFEVTLGGFNIQVKYEGNRIKLYTSGYDTEGEDELVAKAIL